jgi:hypothetical protein
VIRFIFELLVCLSIYLAAYFITNKLFRYSGINGWYDSIWFLSGVFWMSAYQIIDGLWRNK